MSDKKYLFANWKMYLDHSESEALALALAKKLTLPEHIVMAVFPSALALSDVSKTLKDTPISTGAQNIYWIDKGGYTGEISAHMYKAAGCTYALVGHSERRHIFNETNHEVRQKVEAALAASLVPVICVGETEHERQSNKTEETIETQIRSAFHNIAWPENKELIVAYEPVWAIGTGQACDPVEAERMHELIKKQVIALTGVTPVILYGGSVRPENVQQYLNNPNISGVLVGAASANIESWEAIVDSFR
ncbi:MAG: triose-phosphate isomerase [Candidatus Magasanikbacteria bacterium]|nr:triose-phosphate isomerase [Candidatus Magasanikbacteria bacterium]